MASLFKRFMEAWSIFKNPDQMMYKKDFRYTNQMSSTSIMPGERRTPNRSAERTFVNALYTRIAIDCAAVDMEHVIIDGEDRFVEKVDDNLNYVLNQEANIDQTGREFRQELVYNLLVEGVIACIPTLTENTNIFESDVFPDDMRCMRLGIIKEWFPNKIRVTTYNDLTGKDEDITVPKRAAWIIKNPLRHVTNDTNSSLKRLIDKLNLLDRIDNQTGSGKLDMIVQLPYSLKSESKREWAKERKKDIEDQIANSKYGIAYIDAAEHIQQINRPLENNLQAQIEYLTKQVYNQLGLTEGVFNGTANELENMNYYNRTIEPILSFIALEIKRKCFTENQREKGHSIMFFRDPFKLVPVEKLAELADKMTRNEIMTSNEFRSIMGYKPSEDPEADELRNKNLNKSADQQMQGQLPGGQQQMLPQQGMNMQTSPKRGEIQNG